jgi:hypothetical protein
MSGDDVLGGERRAGQPTNSASQSTLLSSATVGQQTSSSAPMSSKARVRSRMVAGMRGWMSPCPPRRARSSCSSCVCNLPRAPRRPDLGRNRRSRRTAACLPCLRPTRSRGTPDPSRYSPISRRVTPRELGGLICCSRTTSVAVAPRRLPSRAGFLLRRCVPKARAGQSHRSSGELARTCPFAGPTRPPSAPQAPQPRSLHVGLRRPCPQVTTLGCVRFKGVFENFS